MYVILGIFIFWAILCALLFRWRSCKIRKKVCALDPCKKSQLLNEQLDDFGFSYRSCGDFFTSRLDAWQRDFGYQTLYDEAAPHAQMVFDCEPVYFNAHGVTWLIEFWKGQYGINTGAEIGVYHAGALISPSDYASTRFQAAENFRLPCISMELWKKDQLLIRHRQRHWWLTGFRVGCFSNPSDLQLKATITFRDYEMADAFAAAMRERGYTSSCLSARDTSVSFLFCQPFAPQPCERLPLTCRFSQWKNRLFCKLYIWVTKPFCRTDDRLIYLSYFLPFTFRKIVQICKPRRYRA